MGKAIKTLNQARTTTFRVLRKWGCDSFKQTQLKKIFYNSTESEASIYKYVKNPRVPLRSITNIDDQ